MNLNEKRQIEALQTIVAATRRAQEETVRLLDSLAEVRWPLPTESLGDVLARQENGLCNISSELARITIQAERAVPSTLEESKSVD